MKTTSMNARVRILATATAACLVLAGPTLGAAAAESDSVLEPQAEAPGSVTGRITTEDRLSLDYGLAEIYDAETLDKVAATATDPAGRYTFSGLEPGDYYVVLSNSDDTTFYYYFADLYRDAPLLRLDMATVVKVRSGETTTGIDADLEPFFGDMFDSSFTDDLGWMRDTGLTTGCGGGDYCPDDPVTRGQMAAFLVRALGLTASNPNIEFSDDDSSVFQSDIEKLATAGITTGCGEGIFCPDDNVTRGQMAAFLVRAIGYTDRGTTDFADDNGSVFEADIERLATAGVTAGCGDGIFCPDDNVTRGQMAAFLHRALGGGVLYPGSLETPQTLGVSVRGYRAD